MTTYDGVAIPQNGPADDTMRLDFSGSTYVGVAPPMAGGVDPAYPRGGSLAMGLSVVPITGFQSALGNSWVGAFIAALTGALGGRLDIAGTLMVGRFIPLSAVYRNSDRITLAGIATNLAGQVLRQVQLQFIGQTVQAHFFGGSADANGIYVAYLETGDTYSAYAYNAATGIVYALDHEDTSVPNTTTLVFRQITKRGGADGFSLKAA